MTAVADTHEDGWLAGRGQHEPNTVFDTGDVMWQTSNTDNLDRIYFNGFVTTWSTSFPLDAQVDGASLHFDYHRDVALLGVWRDCNGDGYIGNEVGPVKYGTWAQYPQDLFSASEISEMEGACPKNTPYNDGTYFNEWRAIGPNARFDRDAEGSPDLNCDPAGRFPTDEPVNRSRLDDEVVDPCWNKYATWTGSPHDISDEDARVWFDLGLPGDGWTPHRTAWFMRGQMNDSDSTIDFTDFVAGGHHHRNGLSETWKQENLPGPTAWEVWNDVDEAKPTIGKCNGSHQFGGGPDNTCGMWPLYQVRRLYNDSNHPDEHSDPMVGVFDEESDCRANEVKLVDDQEVTLPTGDSETVRGTVYYKDVQPSVATNPLMSGSVGGTYENVYGGFDNVNGSHDGECGTRGNWGHLETSDDVDPHKRSVQVRFAYYGSRQYHGLEDAGYHDYPRSTGGVGNTGHWYGGGWIDRTGGMTVSGSHSHRTYYAYVSSAAFDSANNVDGPGTALPAGTQNPFRYGELVCGSSIGKGAGETDGWSCDPDVWRAFAYESAGGGADGEQARENAILVGDPFNLRDADCLDGSTGQHAAGHEVRLSVAPNCQDLRPE